MKDLRPLLKDKPFVEIRESLYYLGRYVKQAASFEKYSKDIFEDAQNSEPSAIVKALTQNLIVYIEKVENKQAKNLTDDEVIFWLDHINEIEENLDPELPDSSIKGALDSLEGFSEPDISQNE